MHVENARISWQMKEGHLIVLTILINIKNKVNQTCSHFTTSKKLTCGCEKIAATRRQN